MGVVAGFKAVLSVYSLGVLSHVLLPYHLVQGYCCDNQSLEPLRYKLNGFYCMIMAVSLFYVAPMSFKVALYENFYSCLMVANVVGLSSSYAWLKKGGREKYVRCVTTDQLAHPSRIVVDNKVEDPYSLSRFYLGCRWNPRHLSIDWKMLLYLVGAITLQMIILSGAQVHINHRVSHTMSRAMLTYVLCFSWFLFEYMLGERVHLYTYDLFAEKVGFKLTWGCLVFYPFFYPIGLHPLVVNAGENLDLSWEASAGIIALFLAGWAITRGANMQKFCFRTNPQQKTFLWVVPQQTIEGTHILCSGWWGVARHFNYFGEIVQAVALALPGVLVGTSLYWRLLPLLYPLYYVALFVTRQMDDDAVCAAKYGAKWSEYVQRVPYRIVPGVW